MAITRVELATRLWLCILPGYRPHAQLEEAGCAIYMPHNDDDPPLQPPMKSTLGDVEKRFAGVVEILSKQHYEC